jgi:hypothetical protein
MVGSIGSGLGLARSICLLGLAAGLLMLPSLVWGTLPSHSSMHNLTWAAQFSEQVSSGIPYPRWLPDSFDGLGAPSFYFYPPLAFWVDALVRVLTVDLLSTSWRLSVTSTALLWASGLAMLVWLRLQQVERRTALIGALVYMAAPYHLIDHYLRGALAEFAAYAALPLVMAGVTLVARRHRAGVLALAAAYAALVTSHLPTALLISLTAIPAYALFVACRAWQSDRFFLLRCGLGIALGLGVSAPYLVPALTLQDAVLIDWMWRYGFQVDQSFLLMPGRWVQPDYMFVVVAACAAGWSLASLSLLGRRGPVLLWMAVSLGVVVLMSGLVPWVWGLPLVSRVGFSWRLLIVVEFAAVTALSLAPGLWREQIPRLLLMLAAIGLGVAATVTIRGIVVRVELAVKGEAPAAQDAREYLPAGFPQRPDAGYADLDLEPAAKAPLIACSPTPRVCRAEPGRFGALRIALDSDQPTTVIVRRFAFPAWQVVPLPVVATEPYRMMSFVAPAGRHDLTLDRQTLPAERWGWIAAALSLISLGLIVAWPAITGIRATGIRAPGIRAGS